MNSKKSYSNITIALVFFVTGIGIGEIVGAINGYNSGYKQGIVDKKLHQDTIKIYKLVASPEELKTEYGYE